MKLPLGRLIGLGKLLIYIQHEAVSKWTDGQFTRLAIPARQIAIGQIVRFGPLVAELRLGSWQTSDRRGTWTIAEATDAVKW
jgi:hypothetical protein